MQKIFLPLLFVFLLFTESTAQRRQFEFRETNSRQRLFDQAVQLKTCKISIEANSFIATTVIEMEFYNPKDQEVEARQLFNLNRGQVITDFYLDLHGKYREGSIEERWKANQAYNSIVGKRIDPALLQMNGQDQYSLNIYPVSAKSSRKIKFIITQMMKAEGSKLIYDLPLNFSGNTSLFNLEIKIKNPASIPYANKGILENHFFEMRNRSASFSLQSNNITLNKPVSFSINQFTNEPQICISKQNGETHFMMRLFPDVPAFYKSTPKAINVYWDVSLSGKERNLMKELDYLEMYINENEIDRTTIILFNHQLQGTIVYNRVDNDFKAVRNFLIGHKYTGATNLDNLNFRNVMADRILLFSDCVNSSGMGQPMAGAVPVNCIISTWNYNYECVKKVIGNSGGSLIILNNTNVIDAVKRTDSAENFLYKFNTSHIMLNETFPIRLGKNILLSGTINQPDNLELIYGNNTSLAKSENYFLSPGEICDIDSYRKMRMLKIYDSLMYDEGRRYYNWQHIIVFGLTEKVVTPQTSYLVLERIEDYINYKIAPPKELEEACAERNYVYRSENKIRAMKTFTEQDALANVINKYNARIYWWDKNAALIDLNNLEPRSKNVESAGNRTVAKSPVNSDNNFAETVSRGTSGDLKEVVVTSAFGIKRTARSNASNVQNLTADQVNTIRQTNINNALAGKVAGTQVRSQSSAKLGAETIVRLRGENGLGAGIGALYVLDGTIMPDASAINPDDIEDYSVLQGPAAAALFGPDGANGAIVMTTKRAQKGYPRQFYAWTEYKLSGCLDEVYLEQIKNTTENKMLSTYQKLENKYQLDVGFYFEMANFFFEKNKIEKAQEIIYNAIELCGGSTDGLTLAAYMYESWHWFVKAIEVYKEILDKDENNLSAKRNLALAYFQNKDIEAAVKTYYSIISATSNDSYNSGLKDNALAEMNAIIAMHKNDLDISYINHNLVRVMPVDLRITLESNYSYTGNTQFIEPGNSKCNSMNPFTTNGGRYTSSDYYRSYNYNYVLNEYSIRNAVAGRYRIKVDAHNLNSYASQIPMYVRVITFKNFQKDNMEMQVKIFDLDNQYGVVELDEVKW